MNRVSADDSRPLRWTAVEDWRWSAGPKKAVRYMDVHPETGELFVLHSVRQEIRVFSARGDSVRVIPLGPLNLSGPRSFFWDGEGALVVRDNDEYLETRADGTPARRSPAFLSSNLPPYQVVLDSGGGLLEMTSELGPISGGHRPWFIRLFRTSGDYARIDTLPPLHIEVALVRDSPIPVPMSNALVVTADRDGSIWWGEAVTYQVSRRTAEGDVTLVFSLEGDPAPIRSDEKERIAKEWSSVYPTRAEEVPDTEPILRRLVSAGDGRILVFPRLEGIEEGTVADVFNHGVYEGRISLPVKLRLVFDKPVVANGAIYGMTEDEDGIPCVVALRIPGWPDRSNSPEGPEGAD